ncbi:MAG: MarR family transcriptional regulator [Marivibrio sp.]|uniref:MarR family winged helix-turn-helix transcriptional regulator n=1 Tax=Marivibrio sp. TaxID=2039719 RepID=UPI0032EDA51E
MPKDDRQPDVDPALADVAARFGPLAAQMLRDNPVRDVWRLSFVANVFTGPLYKAFEEGEGVSRGEFLVLFCLSQATDGLTAQDVCLATGRPKNSISRAVTGLIQKSLIRRSVSAADRRRKELAMTPQGRAVLDRLLPQTSARESAMLAPLSGAERATLSALLMKIAAGAPAWADDPE